MENKGSLNLTINNKKKFSLHEDWTVVILGFLIILVTVSGFILPVPVYNWSNGTNLFDSVLSGNNIKILIWQFVFVIIVAIIGALITGRPLKTLLLGFPIVYLLTVIALIISGSAYVRNFNLEAVIISLSIGLLLRNFFTIPSWLKDALSTELYVKIGLILLGTSVIFGDILKAGTLGLVQALIVVISVWYFAFWISGKLKVDKEMTMMLSSAVSICGVSAAIATSGAIKGDPKKLSYVISLVLITAIPMMVGMPYIAHYLGLSQEVTGAWLGGTIDTTGAVVASGSLVGETALKISTIVKFSQNVLLGIAAFAISIYWSYSKHSILEGEEVKPSVGVIWERFPKFVLGFIAASLIFSFIVSPTLIVGVKGSLKNFQNLWFTLAFTSIGLETKFSDLFKNENRKPLYAFLIAQTFNIFITLIVSYFLFG
jgi:uncharacterized integral membrane protein (TIGR00698 family)